MFSSVLSLLEQKSGWRPLPWATSSGWLILPNWCEGRVLPSSAKHRISEHCSKAQILTSEFKSRGCVTSGLVTSVSEALIWIHMLAVKHVWVQSLKWPKAFVEEQCFRNKTWASGLSDSGKICILAPAGKYWFLVPQKIALPSVMQSFSPRRRRREM